jgi:hypothetical protein
MSLVEPDVSLTDLMLAGECGLFSALLWRRDAKQGSLRWWFVLFFAATGIAALLGAIAHGFIADPTYTRYRILWVIIFGAIGIAAVASWAIGSLLALPATLAKLIIIAVAVSFFVYLLVVIFVSQSFAVAVIYYVPAALFLLVALIIAQMRGGFKSPMLAMVGILLSFFAAYVQQAEISLASLYLSHNALYHIVQAIALLLIFLGAMQLIQPIERVKQQ